MSLSVRHRRTGRHAITLRPRLPRVRGLLLWLALLCSASGSVLAGQADPRPNVILIVADDLGWRDSGAYGSEFYETPNIDRLAAEGMLLTQAYSASPFCSPTRASILSGHNPARLRFTAPHGHLPQAVTRPERGAEIAQGAAVPSATRIDPELPLLPRLLQEAGYHTAFFGKWHLGDGAWSPRAGGFEHAVPPGNHAAAPSYFPPYRLPGYPDRPAGTHLDRALADDLVDHLAGLGEQPFFVAFWPFSVHLPYQPRAALKARYAAKAVPGAAQANPGMGAMVEELDTAIGRLLAGLDQLGLADNTLLLFTSDNGGVDWRATGPRKPPVTSNAPLRGGKGQVYEGGIRVPLIARWPAAIEAATRSDALVASTDIFATVMAAAGLRDSKAAAPDSFSYLPLLQGSATSSRKALLVHSPNRVDAQGIMPATSLRRDDWKLIRIYADGEDPALRHELYNLAEDIGERSDRAAREPVRVRAMAAELERSLAGMDALVPRPGAGYSVESSAASSQARSSLR